MEDGANSKRRRGLGIVTPNACTECRKKRAKCDGQTPCGRCASQKGVECIYEVPVRQSKENMRTEIDQLRTQQRHNERILSALVSDDRSEQVLDQLRSGETLENIAERLEISSGKTSVSGENTTTYSRDSDQQNIGNALKEARSIGNSPLRNLAFTQGPSLEAENQQGPGQLPVWGSTSTNGLPLAQSEDMMNWTDDSGQGSHQRLNYPLIGTWNESSSDNSTPGSTILYARGQGQETILGDDFGFAQQPHLHDHNYNQAWTTVTSDGAFVEHLMALYFCWEYPTFASLSKEHFLEHFRLGIGRHCSSLLVNALLALGCRFSTLPQARTDPKNIHTSGDHFFAEAVRLLKLETDRHKLTTIQALGLMSIREASCGRSSESLFYSGQSIRLAIELGLHEEPEIGSGGGEGADVEHAVRSATFWGAFSLDQAWSLSIGRLPHFSKDLKLVTKPAILEHIEASSWVPYTDDGAPLERSCTQPSNVRSVYKTFCELSEIVHQSSYMMYTPGTNMTGRSLTTIYTEYLRWYDSIPEALRLGYNFTPAVLFAHMYYHYAILLLFRPFIKLDIVGSSVSPRDVCSQAADAISALVNSYSQLYTLQRTPSFVPYFVLASSITHLVTLATHRAGSEHLHQGVADLKEMRGCHGFASRGLDILRFLVAHWAIDHKFNDENTDDDYDQEEKKHEHILRCKPSSTSLNQFCPNIGNTDLLSGIGPVQSNDENPLFWSFPLQGRPMLGVAPREVLEKAGFNVLKS